MKRVLFVDHVDRILGGAEINLIELVNTASTRWQVACACPAESRLGEAVRRLGVPQHEHRLDPDASQVRFMGRNFSLSKSVRSWQAVRAASAPLRNVISEFKPNAVISCTNRDHFCAAAACRPLRVPSIWWVNDIISSDFFSWPVRATFVRKARATAKRLVAVSEFARQHPSDLCTRTFPTRSLTLLVCAVIRPHRSC